MDPRNIRRDDIHRRHGDVNPTQTHAEIMNVRTVCCQVVVESGASVCVLPGCGGEQCECLCVARLWWRAVRVFVCCQAAVASGARGPTSRESSSRWCWTTSMPPVMTSQV